MVDSMSLKKGNARLDGSMSQAHKANGCGVLGDATNTKFHASALCILDSQSELRGEKDVSGALRTLRKQPGVFERGTGISVEAQANLIWQKRRVKAHVSPRVKFVFGLVLNPH
jgi:hypothetical protein